VRQKTLTKISVLECIDAVRKARVNSSYDDFFLISFSHHNLSQSHTQSPQTSWSAVIARRDSGVMKFFTAEIVRLTVLSFVTVNSQWTANRKNQFFPLPQSLSLWPSAYQEAWGLWIWDWTSARAIQSTLRQQSPSDRWLLLENFRQSVRMYRSADW